MISPLAQVDPKAKIAANVTIDAFSVVCGDVEIGEGTHIMPQVTIFNGSRIGKNCKIFPNATIVAIPQDLKYAGEKTTVVIGDNTTVRECVTIHLATRDKWVTKVGNNCLLMAYAHVAHDCIIGNNVILANCVQLAGHVTVDDYAIIAGLSGAHQFTHIGAHAYLGGSSAIRKDVPPYLKAAREPLTYVGVNKVGLQRRGFTKEQIDEITNIYHILFVQGHHGTSRAVELIESQVGDSAVRNEILEFIKASALGIIRRPKEEIDENLAI